MQTDLDDIEIAQKIHDLLINSGKTVSTAESCTCGRIVSTLTCVPEASHYVQGGLAAYQNEVKTKFLGVPADMIEQYDVVSKPVVEQMVRGACKMFNTDYAIASTGYAGRGHDEFPQGMIWIGWGTKDDVHSTMLIDNQGKENNTINAAKSAVKQFYNYLKNNILQEKILLNISKSLKNILNESEAINKIDFSKIICKDIDNPNLVKKIIEKYKDDNGKPIFWLFKEDIEKDSAYLKIEQYPFFIKYKAYLYNNEVIALRAYSTEYFKKYAKDKEHENYIKLISFQINPKYKGNNLQTYDWKKLEQIYKPKGIKGFVLYTYEPSLIKKYEKYGFELEDERQMRLDFK